jgi:hypothetical protein
VNRSPLFYPLNRGLDADAGGAADLQTDVMRFMAIISMCLVAIFALVQSIPVEAPAPIESTVVMTPPPTEPEDRDAPSPQAEAVVLTRPARPAPEPEPEPVVLDRPGPTTPTNHAVARSREPADEITPVAATRAPGPDEGFTLRFESDEALFRLVARDVVGLYAISASGTSRLNIDGGNPAFWSASAPARIHEMDPSTVPENLLAAWRRKNGNQPSSVQWGVALPPAMSRQLNEFLSAGDGGSLVIDESGILRLQR